MGSEQGSIREEFAGLYETHFERVARYIAVRIGDLDIAGKLADEAFVRISRANFPVSKEDAQILLFRVARNLANVHLPEVTPVELEPSFEGECAEKFKQLYKAMGQLSEEDRDIVALRIGAEMTLAEVGMFLDMPADVVRERQKAAFGELGRLMSNDES